MGCTTTVEHAAQLQEDALAQEQGEAVAESPARDDESKREAKPPGALHQPLHHQRQKRVIDASAQPLEHLGGSEEILVGREHGEQREGTRGDEHVVGQ